MSINRKAFGQAMRAALQGPERKAVKFRNHEFHVRPIIRTAKSNVVHVEGHMFHQLTLRPDDKILYSFDVHDGGQAKVEIRFEHVIDKIVKIVRDSIEVPIPVHFLQGGEAGGTSGPPGRMPLDAPATATLKLLANNSGWKAEARFLIANIAARVR